MAEQEQEVKLFGIWESPFVRRVEWALKLKGIEYEYIEEDLVVSKSDLLLKYNPVYKKVPVLVHGGKPIAESRVILEYIEETWKHNPLLPEDPHAKAMARFWAQFIDETLEHLKSAMIFTEGEEQEKELKHYVEALEIIEGELKGKKFLGGEAFGFADIVLGWLPTWLKAGEEVMGIKVFDSNKFPFISEWIKRIDEEVPVIKDNSPPKDKLVLFYKMARQIKLGSPPSK